MRGERANFLTIKIASVLALTMKEKTRNNVILVIDDDEINLQIAKIILEKNFQCQVITVDNGHEGIEILKNQYVSIVLLDILMPEFNGIETLQEIRNDENLKDIPVIMLTASVDRENIKEVRALGVTDYIKKPFMPEELVKRVSKKLIVVEKILIIDEEESNLRTMQNLLEENFHYKVLKASSLKETMSILCENEIALIIASTEMKFINGFKILSFMTKTDKLSKIPFVLSTPDDLTEMIEKLKVTKTEFLNELEESSDSIITQKGKNKVVNIVTNIIGYKLDKRI